MQIRGRARLSSLSCCVRALAHCRALERSNQKHPSCEAARDDDATSTFRPIRFQLGKTPCACTHSILLTEKRPNPLRVVCEITHKMCVAGWPRRVCEWGVRCSQAASLHEMRCSYAIVYSLRTILQFSWLAISYIAHSGIAFNYYGCGLHLMHAADSLFFLHRDSVLA